MTLPAVDIDAFVERFDPSHAARLIAGVDARGALTTTEAMRVSVVFERMKTDYEKTASSIGFAAGFMGSPDSAVPRGALMSDHLKFVLNRWRQGAEDWSTERVENHLMFDLPEFLDQTFDRGAISEWLSESGLPSAYSFGSSGTAKEPKCAVPDLGERERASLFRIIGALVDLAIAPQKRRWPTQAALISELLDNYSDKEGISKSGLETKFAEAKRRLLD